MQDPVASGGRHVPDNKGVFMKNQYSFLYRADGLWVCASLGALAQSASVIPSRFLPGDAVVSGAASDQTAPIIATGGNTMLAVWSDKRSYPAGASLL